MGFSSIYIVIVLNAIYLSKTLKRLSARYWEGPPHMTNQVLSRAKYIALWAFFSMNNQYISFIVSTFSWCEGVGLTISGLAVYHWVESPHTAKRKCLYSLNILDNLWNRGLLRTLSSHTLSGCKTFENWTKKLYNIQTTFFNAYYCIYWS